MKKNRAVLEGARRLQVPVPVCIQTTQDSVPVAGIHEKYDLLETYSGCYVKSYQIQDNNYLTAREDEQRVIFAGWRQLINSFDAGMEAALTVYNRSINMQEFCENVLNKESGDSFDSLRKELNGIILGRMREGRNGIQKDKYLTVAVHADSVKKADVVFRRLDRDMDKMLGKVGSGAKPVSLENRLDILYGIYNSPDEHLITRSRVMDEDGRMQEVCSFDYGQMRSMGLTVNDMIAPSSLEVGRDSLRLGGKYVRVLRVTQLSSQLPDEFLNNVTEMNFNCITTINFKPIPTKRADAVVAKNLSLIRDQKTKQMKAGQKAGVYDDSYISPDIMEREVQALALRDAMREKDEHLFDTVMTVAVFAETKSELDENTDVLMTEYKKGSVTLSVILNQQEEGFNSTLPLCYNQIPQKRTLTSSSLAVFVPFSVLELNDPGGINYSVNLISKNLIVYDRMSSANYNGFLLGCPGMGKSMAAKLEMLLQFLKTDADIVVIDPENEYGALAKLLNGQVIPITPGGDSHINPMEIEADYELGDETNPVNAKADFILKLIECINKSPFGINSVQETIIDECVHALFDRFTVDGRLRNILKEDMPTLTDLQAELAKRREPEARELAMALKLYTGSGSLNTYGFQTNVEIGSRFVVYQIRDVGDRLKNLSMLTILDHIWNQIVRNRKIGRNTWFYVDEIYLLFQNEYSATFLNTLFRRARKYGGVPTGISQNVRPILESPTARDMLQNCNFIEILGQAAPDRESLRKILNLSDTELEYITNSPKGQGILYTGTAKIPFSNEIPKDTMIYRVLTTNPKEMHEFEVRDKREQSRKLKEAKNITKNL